MNVVWTISCFAHEQPDAGVWSALTREVDQWPQARGDVPPPSFMRIFTVGTPHERDLIVTRLREVSGAVVNLGPSTRLDEADFASAEYVAAWPAAERLVVVDPGEALVSSGPCPACGMEDAFDVSQQRGFRVTDDAHDGDVSGLPAGGLAVSSRVLDVLRAVGASGYATRDVLVGPGATVSTRWFQLVAERSVLVPCPVHTQIEGELFCATCGAAHGTVVGYFWAPPSIVAGLDVFARHPSLRTMLHLSRRLADALDAAGVTGLTCSDVVRVCDHPVGSP